MQSYKKLQKVLHINYNFRVAKPFARTIDNYDTPLSTENVIAYKNYVDVAPTIGWNGSNGSIIWSYEIGVGARFVSISDYDTGYQSVSNGKQLYEVRNYTENRVLPMVSSLFRIGFVF
jgi:hypothetical protein